MKRIEKALEINEEGIRKLFPIKAGETSREFHFNLPTEVSMVNSQELFRKEMVEVLFEIEIKFMVYLTLEGPGEGGRKGAEVVARANVIDEGVELMGVDIREVNGRRRVKLQGDFGESDGEEGERMDKSGVGRGEGEGKIIDATRWTSK